jgi:hypothetical protein
MLAISRVQIHCMYRFVHFHRLQEFLYPFHVNDGELQESEFAFLDRRPVSTLLRAFITSSQTVGKLEVRSDIY